MTRFVAKAVAAVVGVVTAAGLWPGPATAGNYEVRSCFAGGEFSPRAFVFARRDLTRGMRLVRACSGGSHARIKGIVTSDTGTGFRPRGSRAMVKLWAPPGTRITSMTWRGGAERSDCGWEMAVYAADGPRVVRTIKKARTGVYRNGEPCRAPRQVVSSHHVHRQVFPEGATRVVQRIVCKGYKSRACSARGANYIRTLASRVTIEDKTPPVVRITGGSLFGGWVSGRREMRFTAGDAVGVESARLTDEAGRPIGSSSARLCDFSNPAPCPNGPGTVATDTRGLAREGTQRVVLQAYDAARNAGTAQTWVRVDNTAPPRVDLNVDGSDGWHRSNGFTVRWTNTPEADRAPIAAAYYRICRADNTRCSATQRRQGNSITGLDGLTVPGPGEWNLTMWRQDAAGNLEADNASVPVKLRFDPEAPRLAFDRSSPSDPTRVSVAVREDVSGLASGRIEMSRAGSGTWQDLPTQESASRLTARIDDSRFAPGTYLLRVQAADRAGNQAATDRRSDGSPMVVTLPLRIRSTMSSGVLTKHVVHRVVRRRGKRRKVRKQISRLVRVTRVRMGRVVRVSGRLADAGGHPLANQTVWVGARSATAPERMAGTVTTNTRGRYVYLTRAQRNTQLRFVYLGTPTVLPTQREVGLRVPARTTLRTRRRRLLNGQTAVFRGALLGGPIPAAGKLVELQVRLTGHWQTFRTVRTSRDGRWEVPYTFRRTVGVQRYAFRARIPRETGYPFEPGRSRRLNLRVRGGG